MTDPATVAGIARKLTKAQRASFLRDTRDPEWEPPMWIRAHNPDLVNYRPPVWNAGRMCEVPRLSWTPLGLAVRAHLERTSHAPD
jgi:hypothetical protein